MANNYPCLRAALKSRPARRDAMIDEPPSVIYAYQSKRRKEEYTREISSVLLVGQRELKGEPLKVRLQPP